MTTRDPTLANSSIDTCTTCGAVTNPLCDAGHHLILPSELKQEQDDESRMRFNADVVSRGLDAAHADLVRRLDAAAAKVKGH